MNSVITGKFIAKLRKDKKLTQGDLANLLQITDKAISRWETGEGYPDITILPKLAEIFNVTIEEILEGAHKNKAGESNEEIKERNVRIRFNNISFLSHLIVTVGFLMTILLVYMTEEVLLSTLFFIVLASSASILYMFKRVEFLTHCRYTDEDKKAIFSHTRNLYISVIMTFSMILPFYVVISNNIFDYKHLLTYSSYFLYALLFGLGGLVISLILMLFHKHKVFNKPIYEKSAFENYLILDLFCLIILIASVLVIDKNYLLIEFLIKLIISFIVITLLFVHNKISTSKFIYYMLGFTTCIILIIMVFNRLPDYALSFVFAPIFIVFMGHSIYKIKKLKKNEIFLIVNHDKNILFLLLSLGLFLLSAFLNEPYMSDKLTNDHLFKSIIIIIDIIWVILDLVLRMLYCKKRINRS